MKSYIGIIVICVMFFLIGLLCLNEILLYTPDSARYIIWANSLANFEGFKDSSGPEPSRYVVHAPLYSVFLAPSAWISANNVMLAKLVTVIFGCLVIFVFYVWLKQNLEQRYALIGAFLLAINPMMVLYSTQILSDIPFILFFILFFFLGKKIYKSKKIKRIDYLFVLIIVCAVFLREVGLSLIITATIYFIWLKQYRRALMILFISLFFYSLWFIRNEMIVAKEEGALFRNTALYLSHIYTMSEASMFDEFIKRLIVNTGVYSKLIFKILFLPDYTEGSSQLIFMKDPIISAILFTMPLLKYVIILLTSYLVLLGAWLEYKSSKFFVFHIVFYLCYLLSILFYVVNDIRFFFPIMILMLHYLMIGLKKNVEWLGMIKKRYRVSICTASLLLMMMPNIGWVQNFISNNIQYSKSPEELFNKFKTENRYPEIFTRPFHLAAKWIVENSDSSDNVFSFWKELSIWLEGRKIVTGSLMTPWNLIDYRLRDYEIKYIVSVYWLAAMNEYESYFANSKRFTFELVHRVANVQIFSVKKKDLTLHKENVGEDNVDEQYNKAMKLIEIDPMQAKLLLFDLLKKKRGSSVMSFNYAVALEFSGQLDSAKKVFEKFLYQQQGGIYMGRAWFHRENIYLLENISNSMTTYEKAYKFHNVASRYWDMGYRYQAMRMMRLALKIDSVFFPALISASFYSFQMRDTLSAKMYIKKLQGNAPFDFRLNSFVIALQYLDSLKYVSNKDHKNRLRLKIVELYLNAGLIDHAIDDLKEIIVDDQFNSDALALLGKIYEARCNYSLAVKYYQKLLTIDPTKEEIKKRVNDLKSKLS